MKKLSILLSLAVAMGFSSCEEDVVAPAAPQSNPQETVMSSDGLTVENTATALDLKTYKDGDGQVPVLKVTELKDAPEGSSLEFEMQVAATSDYAVAQTIATVVKDNTVYANYADIDNAFRTIFGNTPRATNVFVRFAAYLVDKTTDTGNTRVRLGESASTFYGYGTEAPVTVTPIDKGIVVDAKYYFVDANFDEGWDQAMTEMEHVVADGTDAADLIANPVFRLTGKFEAGMEYMVIGSGSINDAKADQGNEYLYAWGLESNGTNGKLIKGENSLNFTFAEDGTYTITVNMLELTFKVERVLPTMYIIGETCGNWDWAKAPEMIPANDNNSDTEGKYWWMTYFTGNKNQGVKFNNMREWNGNEFGYSGATLKSYVDGVNFVDEGGNIQVDKAGWYLVGLEKKQGTAGTEYVVNLFPADVYVIGDVNGGTWGADAKWKFTVPTTADGDFVSPAFAKEGNLRMSINPMIDEKTAWIGDWWKSELLIKDGSIDYRGTNGDFAYSVAVTAGQKAYLNFSTGAASIK